MIAKLTADLEKFPQQLALGHHHGSWHNEKDEVHQLQIIVDELKAKNIELEIQFEAFKEKAAQELQLIKANYEKVPSQLIE